MLAIEAASEDDVRATLGRDPWSGTHLVVESVDALDDPARRAQLLASRPARLANHASCASRTVAQTRARSSAGRSP